MRPQLQTPEKPTRQRVSNAVGFVVLGNFAYRTLILLDCPEFRALGEDDDLWTGAQERAVKIVLGIVDLQAKDNQYTVTAAISKDGYSKMLKELTSGLASLEGVKQVDFLGTTLRTRPWGPFPGVRRRGQKAMKVIQRKREISDEHLDDLLTQIKGRFFDFFAAATRKR